MKSKLTVKQQKFVQYVVEGKKQTEAYRLAGYKNKHPDSVKVLASRLLTNSNISTAIEKGRGELAKKHDIKSEEIIQELKSIGLSNITDIMSWDESGELSITPSEELPESVKKGIKKIKCKKRTYYDKSTGEKDYDDIDIEFEMHNKVQALEKLGVYRGLWKDEKGDTLVLNQFLTQIQQHIGMVEAK